MPMNINNSFAGCIHRMCVCMNVNDHSSQVGIRGKYAPIYRNNHNFIRYTWEACLQMLCVNNDSFSVDMHKEKE